MTATEAFYSRPVIIRGEQCAEAPLDPGGATKQLPARRYLALKAASPPSLHGLPSAAGAVHRNTVGRSSARSLGVVAQEVRMPAAPSSACPRPRPASGVQCPVSGVRCERPVSTLACPWERCPVSGAGV